jgi:hypothetical protein
MSVVHIPSPFSISDNSLSGQTITVANTASSSSAWTTNASTGVNIAEGCDLTIGDRSLSKFMDQVEERLAILRPNEGLESRWEQLKELRRQYHELEKDLLEKEKIMDILKDTHGR